MCCCCEILKPTNRHHSPLHHRNECIVFIMSSLNKRLVYAAREYNAYNQKEQQAMPAIVKKL